MALGPHSGVSLAQLDRLEASGPRLLPQTDHTVSLARGLAREGRDHAFNCLHFIIQDKRISSLKAQWGQHLQNGRIPSLQQV